jgi:hypothetical protein
MAKKASAPKQRSPKKGSEAKPSGPIFVERPDDIKGIEGLSWVVNSSLTNNPQNWKHHPRRQQEVLRTDIGEEPGKGLVGWAGASLYNKRTNRLIDGHGRKALYSDKPDAIVPVLIGDWSEEEERTILLHLDPTAAMAETNIAKLKELQEAHRKDIDSIREELSEKHNKTLESINRDLDLQSAYIESGGQPSMMLNSSEFADDFADSDDDTPVALRDVNPNLEGMQNLKGYYEIPFDTWDRGPYDIPLLAANAIPTLPQHIKPWVGPETKPFEEFEEDHAFLYVYGSCAIEKIKSEKMVVSFWTYDSKFNAVWNDPTKFTARLLNLKIPAIVLPDFSTFTGGYLADTIWQVFKSRWLGRYWQSVGLDVIPNLPWCMAESDDLFKLGLAGVPIGCPTLAVQVQSKGDGDPVNIFNLWKVTIQKAIKAIKPKQLLLYHGPNLPDHYEDAFDCEVIKCITWMSERRKIMRDKDYISAK